jgi:hypothetical protein
MKPIRLTKHAFEQCQERGTNEQEVRMAVEQGGREPVKKGREMCRFNFSFNSTWQGKFYAIKQVAPVIVDEPDEIVVITVYTFYF